MCGKLNQAACKLCRHHSHSVARGIRGIASLAIIVLSKRLVYRHRPFVTASLNGDGDGNAAARRGLRTPPPATQSGFTRKLPGRICKAFKREREEERLCLRPRWCPRFLLPLSDRSPWRVVRCWPSSSPSRAPRVEGAFERPSGRRGSRASPQIREEPRNACCDKGSSETEQTAHDMGGQDACVETRRGVNGVCASKREEER